MEKQAKIYLEYLKKFSEYNLNSEHLKELEELCLSSYKPEMGINLDTYIRVNLNMEISAILASKIDLTKYKNLVINHSKELIKDLSKEEIDIIFDDTLLSIKDNYDKTESIGSYMVRTFKNNLIDYVNNNYNKNYVKFEENKINLLKKK